MGLLFLAPFGLLQAAAAAPDYVPDTGWRDDGWARIFYEDWFGHQLRAMREPPLAGPAELGGYRERFRLLVLPSFDPAYAYRIDIAADGSARLHWVRLSGRGGYEPGKVARAGSRRLRVAELRAWRQALAAAALPVLKRENPPDPVTIDANGEQLIHSCFDGTALVFEHLGPQGRTFVTRHCHTEEALRRLERAVHRLMPRNRMN